MKKGTKAVTGVVPFQIIYKCTNMHSVGVNKVQRSTFFQWFCSIDTVIPFFLRVFETDSEMKDVSHT